MTTSNGTIKRIKPALDPGFLPAILWRRDYEAAVAEADGVCDVVIGLGRPDGTLFRQEVRVLSHCGENVPLNEKYVERLVKFLLWHKGGSRIYIGGHTELGECIRQLYAPNGRQAFDYDIMGRRMFLEPMAVTVCPASEVPPASEKSNPLGRNLDGCRIGFDLGGSDRKAAALVDGEVTALAGSMSLNDNAVLGISMGTSTAAGYCNAQGTITEWLNELAFAPIDYRDDAPQDEWSKDVGCGVQYFSQQAVARLAHRAGIALPNDMPLPEKLVQVQELMATSDPRARQIYETIGTYFGYAIPLYAQFYEIRHLLLLGRVTSGRGGQSIIDGAMNVLWAEFPELAEQINITTPDEQLKRHGQAIAAASLPKI